MVAMLKPTSPPVAFGLARLQEEELMRRNRSPKAPPWFTNLTYRRLVTPPTLFKPSGPNFL